MLCNSFFYARKKKVRHLTCIVWKQEHGVWAFVRKHGFFRLQTDVTMAHVAQLPPHLHINLLHLQQKPGINSLCSGLKRAIEKKKTRSGFTPPQTPRVKLWSSSWWDPQNTHCAAGVSVKSQRQPMQTAVIAISFTRARKLTARGVVSNAESLIFFNYLFWSSPESLCEQALKVEQTKQCAQSRGKQRKMARIQHFSICSLATPPLAITAPQVPITVATRKAVKLWK